MLCNRFAACVFPFFRALNPQLPFITPIGHRLAVEHHTLKFHVMGIQYYAIKTRNCFELVSHFPVRVSVFGSGVICMSAL